MNIQQPHRNGDVRLTPDGKRSRLRLRNPALMTEVSLFPARQSACEESPKPAVGYENVAPRSGRFGRHRSDWDVDSQDQPLAGCSANAMLVPQGIEAIRAMGTVSEGAFEARL